MLQCHVCAFCILSYILKIYNSRSYICISYIYVISLILSVAFSRGRLCENVLEGSSHHHVHAQRAGGQLLPGGQSRPAQQQTQTGLGVSFHCGFFQKSKWRPRLPVWYFRGSKKPCLWLGKFWKAIFWGEQIQIGLRSSSERKLTNVSSSSPRLSEWICSDAHFRRAVLQQSE